MTKPLNLLAVAFLMLLAAASAHAQFLPFGDGKSYLHPSNASSADNLKLALSRYCGGGFGSSQANLYRISMSQNNITVMLTNRSDFLQSTCFPSPLDEIDLGRLLPGNYTLTITEPAEVPPGTSPIRTVIANYAFIVADARTTKAAPYVRLDYSGHWWDPLDSGWGLSSGTTPNRPPTACWRPGSPTPPTASRCGTYFSPPGKPPGPRTMRR